MRVQGPRWGARAVAREEKEEEREGDIWIGLHHWGLPASCLPTADPAPDILVARHLWQGKGVGGRLQVTATTPLSH